MGEYADDAIDQMIDEMDFIDFMRPNAFRGRRTFYIPQDAYVAPPKVDRQALAGKIQKLKTRQEKPMTTKREVEHAGHHAHYQVTQNGRPEFFNAHAYANNGGWVEEVFRAAYAQSATQFAEETARNDETPVQRFMEAFSSEGGFNNGHVDVDAMRDGMQAFYDKLIEDLGGSDV